MLDPTIDQFLKPFDIIFRKFYETIEKPKVMQIVEPKPIMFVTVPIDIFDLSENLDAVQKMKFCVVKAAECIVGA